MVFFPLVDGVFTPLKTDCCAFYDSGIFGHDPLANYQFHHPSNPHSQPNQQPYVKRTKCHLCRLVASKNAERVELFVNSRDSEQPKAQLFGPRKVQINPPF